MSEKPIIFNGEMVRAILDGRKTQTRRLVKPQPTPPAWCNHIKPHFLDDGGFGFFDEDIDYKAPYSPGDHLWVRETWCPVDDTEFGHGEWIDYRATPTYESSHPAGWDAAPNDPQALKWRPSIHMPRWASRITLEVTGVRVERVQDITEEDAQAEGILFSVPRGGGRRRTFEALWEDIYPGSWERNDWVWVIEFRRVKP